MPLIYVSITKILGFQQSGTFLTLTMERFAICANFAAECEALSSRFKLATTITGTQKLHSFVVLSDITLNVSEYSLSIARREMSIIKNSQEPSHINAGYAVVKYDGRLWVASINEADPEKNEIERLQ